MSTIPSSPATFSNAGPPATQTLTFAIPAGVYTLTGSYWSETGTTTFAGIHATDEIETGGSTAVFPAKAVTGSFGPLTVDVTPTQLAFINAAAGGTLTAQFDYNDGAGLGDSITAFTLTLATSGGGVVVGPGIGPTSPTAYAQGYQANVDNPTTGFFVANRLLPGMSDGTGYVLSNPTAAGNQGITGLSDLWTAQAFDSLRFQAGFEGMGQLIVEESGDAVSWTALPFTLEKSVTLGGTYSGVSLTSDGSGGYTFSSGGAGAYGTSWYLASLTGGAVSNRYIRLSLRDTAAGANTPRVGLLQFWPESSGAVVSATPHSLNGAPSGSGGFTLNGTLSWIPGVQTTMDGETPPGTPGTYHVASGVILTFFQGTTEIGYDGYVSYPPAISLQQVTTAADGTFSYSFSGGNLTTLMMTTGPWLPATYDDWLAVHTARQFGICYDVVFFGNTYEEGYNQGYPIPDQCVFFKRDPGHLEYANYGQGFASGNGVSEFYAGFDPGMLCINIPELIGPTYGYTFYNNNDGPFQPSGLVIPQWSAWSPGLEGDGPWFMSGGMTLDWVQNIFANVSAWQQVSGVWNCWSGAAITVTDNFGRSETVTSQGPDTWAGSIQATATAANGFFQIVNPLFITGATVDTTGGTLDTIAFAASPSGSATFPGYQISPTLDPRVSNPFGSDCEYNDDVPIPVTIANSTLRTMFYCITTGSGPGTLPSLQPRADTFNGMIALTWVNADGSLWVAIHQASLMNIGAGASGWETPQELFTSGELASALCYLPTGRLCLFHTSKCQYSDRFGLGDWQDLANTFNTGAEVMEVYSAGRGEEQGWVSESSGSGCGILKCQDRLGEQFILWEGSALAGTRFVVSLRNGRYLYAGTETSTLVVDYFPGDGTGGAVDAINDGELIGLVYTAAGVVVGLWHDYTGFGGSQQFYAIRSFNKGLTWIQDSDLIPADKIPALTVPPALVCIEEYVIAIWAEDNLPQMAISADSGRTWA